MDSSPSKPINHDKCCILYVDFESSGASSTYQHHKNRSLYVEFVEKIVIFRL